MISAQEFRNNYEPFYNSMRLYLWPYDVLEQLGAVEVDIYDAFVDRSKLSNDFAKLKAAIREVLDDDEELSKACNELEELINSEDQDAYYTITRVGEKNPENSKALVDTNKSDDIDGEFKGGVSYENKKTGI